jgi:hypothetical protein
MNIRTFSHLGNQTLERRLAEEFAHQHVSTATLLALIAEVDQRCLYLPAGYPSMCAYCVHKFHLTKEAALKRIHAVRAARKFEGILDAVADGRLHLTAGSAAGAAPDAGERRRVAGGSHPQDQGGDSAAARRALPPAGSADAGGGDRVASDLERRCSGTVKITCSRARWFSRAASESDTTLGAEVRAAGDDR